MRLKRALSVAALCCNACVTVAFFILLWNAGLATVPNAVLGFVGLVSASGLVVAAVRFTLSLRHDVGYLSIGPNGCVTIEYAALRSVARKSIDAVTDVRVVKISPKVINKASRSFVDFHIDITDIERSALQPIAAVIQACVRREIEEFCGIEVRNVYVNYVMKSDKKAVPPQSPQRPQKPQKAVKALVGRIHD